MDFCSSNFGKPLNILTVEDIERFFQTERLETDQLEFKSIHPSGDFSEKIAGVQRSISAFLNSSGGVIVWGAPNGHKVEGRKEKVFKGDLTFIDRVLEKDFLISKLSDSIVPLPSNIRLNILESAGRCLVIFEIDSSSYSPHQFNGSYFMRLDGQTRPAPHHYIEALFKKISYPNLEAFLKIVKITKTASHLFEVKFDLIFFNWTPLQNEENLSYRIVSDGVFPNYKNPNTIDSYHLGGHEFRAKNVLDVFHFGEPLQESFVIQFNLNDLKDQVARIHVTFGGKLSPRKTSDYEIDFKRINFEKPAENLITECENVTRIELQEKMGITKETILKKFLE